MKINIGGQKGRQKGNFQGWKIVDIRSGADFKIDIMSKKLPFNDNSVEAIYSSHTLEHIFPDRVPFVLSESYRVLQKNGLIRIVVPDIDIAINAYQRGDKTFLGDKRNPRKNPDLPEFSLCYLSSWFFTYNRKAKGNERIIGGHVMAYNWEVITYYLKKAGFQNIIRKSYGDCSKVFRKCDFERYANCSLYVEANK